MRALIVMGVSGSGKTSLGARLAAQLGWPFLDGDAFHTPAARARMAEGQGLSDADRAPWLARLAHELAAQPGGVVLACSALRRRYRVQLGLGTAGVRFVYLRVPAALLHARLQARPQHYAGPALLASQLAALEEPGPAEGVLTLEVTAQDTLEALAARALAGLGPA